jgi:SAM-dependent methyltransferase
MKFQESKLAHAFLDGLKGIEIGGSAHNAFGLDTKNVDYTEEVTVFKQAELDAEGESLPIDIVAMGDDIPLPDESQDFVISSHAIEHFIDPVRALKEWYRLIRPGGYIYIIAPHKERTFDKDRPRTPLSELIERHANNLPNPEVNKHFSVWTTEDFVELVEYLGWSLVFVEDVDDKVGNGFTIVIQKGEDNVGRELREALYVVTGKLYKNDMPSQKELTDITIACAKINQDLKMLQNKIAHMRNSIFWKIRRVYMKVKGLLKN